MWTLVKKNILPILYFLLALVVALLKFSPFLAGKTLVFGDNYWLLVPGKLFTSQWVARGIVPFWNPYIFSGVNWVADINNSMLYPFGLLFGWLHPAVALNITIILHLLIGYTGMYLLARQLRLNAAYAFLAGCLWMLSTQMMGSVHNLSTIQALPWIPMVIWAGLLVGKKRWAPILFAFVVLAQLAAGYPQHTLYAIFTAVVFSFFLNDVPFSKRLRAWASTGLLTIGLSAVVWFPFVEGFLNSTRIVQTIEQAQMGSLHPAMLVKTLVPAFFDNQQLGMKWGPAWTGQPNVSFYFGWLGLVVLGWRLIVFKKWDREERFFACVTLVTLALSLGTYLPGYEFLQKIVPLLQWGRGPSIWMTITTIVLILWIVKSLSIFKLTIKSMKILLTFGSVLLLGSLGVWWLANNEMIWVWSQLNRFTGNVLASSAFHTMKKDQVILQSISASMALAAFFFITCVVALYYKKTSLLIALIIVDVLIGTQHMFQFAPNKTYDIPRALPALETSKYRVLTRNGNAPYADFGAYWEAMVVRAPFSDSFIDGRELQFFDKLQALRDGLTLDWNMVKSVPMVHGYAALLPRDYGAIWESDSQSNINLIDFIEPTDSKLSDWSVKYYLVDTWYPTYGEVFPYPVVWRDGRYVVYELSALPRFRYSDGRPLDMKAFVENPNEISFSLVNQVDQAQIVVADRYDKNWRVTVNGKEVPLENYQGMRRFIIPVGEISVKMWFQPVWFYRGVVISGLTLSVIIGYLGVQYVRSRRTSS